MSTFLDWSSARSARVCSLGQRGNEVAGGDRRRKQRLQGLTVRRVVGRGSGCPACFDAGSNRRRRRTARCRSGPPSSARPRAAGADNTRAFRFFVDRGTVCRRPAVPRSRHAAYSRRCAHRVWRAEHFSWQMTSMLHRFHDDDAFQQRLQRAQLDYTVRSPAAATSLRKITSDCRLIGSDSTWVVSSFEIYSGASIPLTRLFWTPTLRESARCRRRRRASR